MKNLKYINEFLIKENENLKNSFKNETKLKDFLMNDKSFAEGEVHQALMNVGYDEWNSGDHPDWSYSDMLDWVDEEFGKLLRFSTMLGSYNYQVGNGGHQQYYDNGYASSEQRGFGSFYDDIDKHDEFVELFTKLGIDKIKLGKDAYSIIRRFELDLEDELEKCYTCNGDGIVNCEECDGNGAVDCSVCNGNGETNEGEMCVSCGGDGTIKCENCEGFGTVECVDCMGLGEVETGNKMPDLETWSKLDSEWYVINDDFIDEFDKYLKNLTLEGKKISELIPFAHEIQKYNL